MLRVTIAEANGRIEELVSRAEAGDEVVLLRQGRDIARLVPVTGSPDMGARRRALQALRDASKKALPGPTAERSQDFLYGDDGLPR